MATDIGEEVDRELAALAASRDLAFEELEDDMAEYENVPVLGILELAIIAAIIITVFAGGSR